jgi:hypothetical protein
MELKKRYVCGIGSAGSEQTSGVAVSYKHKAETLGSKKEESLLTT